MYFIGSKKGTLINTDGIQEVWRGKEKKWLFKDNYWIGLSRKNGSSFSIDYGNNKNKRDEDFARLKNCVQNNNQREEK